MIGYIIPDAEKQPKAMVYIGEMTGATTSRGSSRFHINLDEGLEEISKNLVIVSNVTEEDLNNPEKLADTFDVQTEQARSVVPELAMLTVERNERTEKYFLEFDRIQQKLSALAATLDNYLSIGFRDKIRKLKQVNEIFREIANFTAALIGGRAFGYALDVSKLFPEIKAEETAVRICAIQPNFAGCRSSGPFPRQLSTNASKIRA